MKVDPSFANINDNDINLTAKNQDGFTPIREATKKKDWFEVIRLAERIKDLDNLNDGTDAGFALLEAVRNNQPEVVEKLLQIKKMNVSRTHTTTKKEGYNALHYAVARGLSEIAVKLVDYGFDVNQEDDSGSSPLKIALEHENWELIQKLIKYNARLFIKNKEGKTLIEVASATKKRDVVIFLARHLKNTFNFHDGAHVGQAVLKAVKANDIRVLKELLEIPNINFSIKNKEGYTALKLAATEGMWTHVIELAKKIQSTDNERDGAEVGQVLLHALQHHQDLDELLKIKNIDFSVKNKDGKTVLELAAMQGRWADVIKLAKRIQSADNTHDSAAVGQVLLQALLLGKDDVVVQLLNIKNINVSVSIESGKTRYGALHLAIKTGRLDIAAQLITYGFKINEKIKVNNQEFSSPMELAFENLDSGAIRLFAEHEGDLLIKNKDNWTPIEWAAENDKWDLVIHLLKQIPRDASQYAAPIGHALLCALQKNQKDAINELVKMKHISINWRCTDGQEKGYGILHFAVLNNDKHAMKEIVNRGFKPNKQFEIEGQFGPSAMQIALYRENVKAIKFLAKHGGDLLIKNKNDLTPIEWAAENDKWDLVMHLVKQIPRDTSPYKTLIGRALFCALQKNQKDVINELLKIKDIDINWHFTDGQTKGYGTLHFAVLNNDLSTLQELVKRGFNPNKQLSGPSAMQVALEKENWEAIKFLAKHGGDLTLKNKDGKTALELAALQGRWADVIELAKTMQTIDNVDDLAAVGQVLLQALLLDKDNVVIELLNIDYINLSASFDKGEKKGYGPLHLALEKNKVDIAEELIRYGFDVHGKFSIEEQLCLSPMELLFRDKNWDAVALLVKKFPSLLSSKNLDGKTLIESAAIQELWPLVKELALEIPASDFNDSAVLSKILLQAIEREQEDVVEALLKTHNIDLSFSINTKKNKGCGALHLALERNNVSIAEKLIEHGFVLNKKFTVDGQLCLSPMELLFQDENWHAVKFLIEKFPYLLSSENIDGKTLIELAAIQGLWPLVMELALQIQKSDFDLSAVLNKILFYAIQNNKEDVVNKLLKIKRIDFLIKNEEGKTLIEYAAAKGQWSVVMKLIDKMQRTCDFDGDVAGLLLLEAVQQNQKDVVLELLKIKNINLSICVTDGKRKGCGALHLAVANDNVEMTKELIKSGLFNVNEKFIIEGVKYLSPIQIAHKEEKLDVMVFWAAQNLRLLTIKNHEGQTLIELLARKKKWSDVINLLKLIKRIENFDITPLGGLLLNAVEQGQTAAVIELLKIKNINLSTVIRAGDRKGYGALHVATKNNQFDMIEALINSGCDSNTKYTIEKQVYPSPMEIAFKEKNWKVMALFVNKNPTGIAPLVLLKNEKFNRMIEGIITNAVSSFNREIQKNNPQSANYEISSSDKIELQKLLIHSLLSNEQFIKKVLSTDFNNDINELMTYLTEHIRKNMLTLKTTPFTSLFSKASKILVLNPNCVIPSLAIDTCISNLHIEKNQVGEGTQRNLDTKENQHDEKFNIKVSIFAPNGEPLCEDPLLKRLV